MIKNTKTKTVIYQVTKNLLCVFILKNFHNYENFIIRNSRIHEM